MSQKEMLNRLCEKLELGSVQGEPVMVTGGLLHKMYHVTTERGEYAIKALNPDIMQRPDALQNMINGELVSNALKETVPLVAAKVFQGEYVILYEETYYMVFDWLEGRSVLAPDITVCHCEKIGGILGRIHAKAVQIPGMEREESVRDVYAWEEFFLEVQDEQSMQNGESLQMEQDVESGQIVQGVGKKKAWDRGDEETKESRMILLADNVAKVKYWDAQAVLGLQTLSAHQVISHRDLDPKNVMWQQDAPYVIDWEAAGYVNPYQELVEVLNYWALDADGSYDKTKFTALMHAYTDFVDISGVNWDAVLYAGMDGMLGWLAYNVKRALGLEGTGHEDRIEGEKQVAATIRELAGYAANMEILKNWLEGKVWESPGGNKNF